MKITDPDACRKIADEIAGTHAKSKSKLDDSVNVNFGVYSAKHPEKKVGTVRMFGSPELIIPEKLLQGAVGTALCLLLVGAKFLFRKKH